MKVTDTFYIEYGDQEYEVVMSANCVHDSNYGADADGNRGMAMDWVEDIELVSMDEDALKLPLEVQKTIEDMAYKQAEDHDWWASIVGEISEPDDY